MVFHLDKSHFPCHQGIWTFDVMNHHCVRILSACACGITTSALSVIFAGGTHHTRSWKKHKAWGCAVWQNFPLFVNSVCGWQWVKVMKQIAPQLSCRLSGHGLDLPCGIWKVVFCCPCSFYPIRLGIPNANEHADGVNFSENNLKKSISVSRFSQHVQFHVHLAPVQMRDNLIARDMLFVHYGRRIDSQWEAERGILQIIHSFIRDRHQASGANTVEQHTDCGTWIRILSPEKPEWI